MLATCYVPWTQPISNATHCVFLKFISQYCGAFTEFMHALLRALDALTKLLDISGKPSKSIAQGLDRVAGHLHLVTCRLTDMGNIVRWPNSEENLQALDYCNGGVDILRARKPKQANSRLDSSALSKVDSKNLTRAPSCYKGPLCPPGASTVAVNAA